MIPAPATRMSTPSPAARTLAAAWASSSGDATSATNASAKPPACSISSTAAAKRSLERASTYTLAPRAARRRAHALPIPLDPPVTTQTAPANSFAIPPYPPATRRASRLKACSLLALPLEGENSAGNKEGEEDFETRFLKEYDILQRGIWSLWCEGDGR